MRISLDGFEAPRVSEAVQHTQISGAGLAAGAQAVERLANVAGNMAQKFGDDQRAEASALARAKAANALTEHDLKIRALTDDVSGRVTRGEIPYEKAGEVYATESAKIQTPQLDLDPAIAEHYQGGVRNNVTAGELQIGNSVKVARRADGRLQIDKMLDDNQKLAGAPGADVEKINATMDAWAPMAQQFGIDPSVFAKQVQDAKDANWTGQATGHLLNSRNDAEALKALEFDLTSDEGFYAGKLDTAKRLILLRGVQDNQARLVAAIDRDGIKAEARGERAVTFLTNANATGIPLLPEKIMQLQAETVGTSHEQEFRDGLAIGNEVARVRSAPFAQQQQYIAQLEQQLQQGSADPVRDKARLGTLRTALEANRKLAKESPMLFLQNQGGEPVEPIDFSKIASGDGALMEAQLASRYHDLEAMRAKFGPDVSMNPWRPEEAGALRAALGKLDANPDVKLMMLGLLAKNAPSPEAYRDTLAPIAQSDRVSYVAGVEQFLKHESGKSGGVAPIIMHGAKVLKDKSTPMPTEAKFQAAFNEDVGDAYPPGSQDRADAFLKYKTIYAGMADKLQSGADADTTELDETLRTTATSLSTGGIIEHNGRRTVKPWAMDDAEFTERVGKQLETVAAATGFPADTLADMPLMPISGHEGLYLVINQGRAQIDPKTGKPVIVSVK